MIRRLIRWLKWKLFGISADCCTIGDTIYKIKSWRIEDADHLDDYVEGIMDLDVEYTLSQPTLTIPMNDDQVRQIVEQGRCRFTDEQWARIKGYVGDNPT